MAKNASGKEYHLSRLPRLEFHGAHHLVQLRGREECGIFFDARVLGNPPTNRWQSAPNLMSFLTLLDRSCSECGAQLFGYCVVPNEAAFVLRILGAPLESLMQRLAGRYSHYLHLAEVLPKDVGAFASRYQSKVLAPEYLPHAVRRIHALALRAGLARRAIDYPFSSARAYVGEHAPVHLETDAVWRALERKGLFGLRGYREFMEKPETLHVAQLFEQGSPLDSRLIGGSVFVAQLKDAAKHPQAPIKPQQLLAAVAKLLGSDSDAVLAGPQRVLARSLVAWHAQRSGSTSLKEVSEWFAVSRAALNKALRHHRRASPELFRKPLPGLEQRNGGE